MKIAVYGAGSLGTIIGAYLTKEYGKNSVDLIAHGKQHIQDLNDKGAHVTGSVDFSVPVSAKTPEELKDQEYDIVLLLTKQTHNDEVLKKIKKILKTNGTLVSLQNGVPEVKIINQINPKNVVAGSVEFGGTLLNNVESELTTELPLFNKLAFQIGELDGKTTPRIEKIKEVLSNVGGTEISDNLLGTKWSKLLINASFSGLSAASNATFGQIADDKIGIESALNIINEGLQAGKADGVVFAKMSSLDLNSFAINSQNDEKKQLLFLNKIMQNSKNLKASMLQDLEKGRKTEINDINGVIAETGKKHDIPTPFNDLVIEIVTKAQNTGNLPEFNDTMQKFSALLTKEN